LPARKPERNEKSGRKASSEEKENKKAGEGKIEWGLYKGAKGSRRTKPATKKERPPAVVRGSLKL